MDVSNAATCKTCVWWGKSQRGTCDLIDQGPRPGTRDAAIEVTVADDYGLDVAFKTGPDFGCVLHEAVPAPHSAR